MVKALLDSGAEVKTKSQVCVTSVNVWFDCILIYCMYMSQDGYTALSNAFQKRAPIEVFWLLSEAGAQISWIDRDSAFLKSFFLSEGRSLFKLKHFWFEFLTSGSDHRSELLQALIESHPAAEWVCVAKTVADLQFGGVKCNH